MDAVAPSSEIEQVAMGAGVRIVPVNVRRGEGRVSQPGAADASEVRPAWLIARSGVGGWRARPLLAPVPLVLIAIAVTAGLPPLADGTIENSTSAIVLAARMPRSRPFWIMPPLIPSRLGGSAIVAASTG